MNTRRFTILLLAAAAAAAAPVVSIDPVSQQGGVGSVVTADINLSGTGITTDSIAGSFDLHVDFNPAVLSPLDVMFGPGLGDPALLEAFTGFSLLPVRVEFSEASLLSPADLLGMSTDPMRLATLSFRVTGGGISPLTFSHVVVDDPFGGKLDVTTETATITGIVPEPAYGAAAALALLAIWLRARSTARVRAGVPRAQMQ